VTFPVVDGLLRHHPDLCLVHLDAHSDLYFCNRPVYNHGAAVSSLLEYSDLARVRSFGARTFFDRRVENLGRLEGAHLAERVRLYSLAALKRMLAEPGAFEEALAEIGEAPCYLTIDLDVLSPGALAGQVSTPAGAGLEWWELFETLLVLLHGLRVVGCDVVEFNPTRRNAPSDDANLAVLLLLLIDGLARHRRG
jgi:agmatinase